MCLLSRKQKFSKFFSSLLRNPITCTPIKIQLWKFNSILINTRWLLFQSFMLFYEQTKKLLHVFKNLFSFTVWFNLWPFSPLWWSMDERVVKKFLTLWKSSWHSKEEAKVKIEQGDSRIPDPPNMLRNSSNFLYEHFFTFVVYRKHIYVKIFLQWGIFYKKFLWIF